MLSDEEKKAIVELNHFSNMTAYWKQEEYTNSEIDNYIETYKNRHYRLAHRTCYNKYLKYVKGGKFKCTK